MLIAPASAIEAPADDAPPPAVAAPAAAQPPAANTPQPERQGRQPPFWAWFPPNCPRCWPNTSASRPVKASWFAR